MIYDIKEAKRILEEFKKDFSGQAMSVGISPGCGGFKLMLRVFNFVVPGDVPDSYKGMKIDVVKINPFW